MEAAAREVATGGSADSRPATGEAGVEGAKKPDAWGAPGVSAPNVSAAPGASHTPRAPVSAASGVSSARGGSSASTAWESPSQASGYPSQASGYDDRDPSTIVRVLREFFTGGNTLVRVGVLILFFGVAFLLRYLAEHTHVPIQFRLSAVAFGGVALLILGWLLRVRRPGYALAIQGGGVGILYLTAFAALRPVFTAAAGRGIRNPGTARRAFRCTGGTAKTRRRLRCSPSPVAFSLRSRLDGSG